MAENISNFILPPSFPYFFLVISILFTTLLFWVYQRNNVYRLRSSHVLNVSLIIMLAAFWGARLTHVFWEDFQFYQNNPSKIFDISSGGFVYFGGAIAAFLFSFIYLKFKNEDWLSYADLFAVPASLGTSLGRIGCALAGCCYGRSCDLPWAWNQRHPTQIYSLAWDLALTILLLILEKKKRPNKGGLFFGWITAHSIGRLIIEQFRADFRGPVFLISFSSWISLGLIAIGIAGIYKTQIAISLEATNKPEHGN